MTRRDKVYKDIFNIIMIYEQSGLSRADYCRKHRIRQNLLHYYWKIYEANQTNTNEHPAFISIRVDEHEAITDHNRIILTGHGGLQVFFPTQSVSIPLICHLIEGWAWCIWTTIRSTTSSRMWQIFVRDLCVSADSYCKLPLNHSILKVISIWIKPFSFIKKSEFY